MNRDILRYSWIVGLLLLLCGGAALADDFDPANPPDPQRPADPPAPVVTYQLTATATMGNSASGSGKYEEGTSVYLNTSAVNTSFKFQYWTKNGEQYTTSKSFYYTMTAADVTFQAVYIFDPASPSEPVVPEEKPVPPVTYQLTATATMGNNASGTGKYQEGASVNVSTSAVNTSFKFQYWTKDGEQYTTSKSFSYTMTAAAVAFEAVYIYDPSNPNEPTDPTPQEEEIDNTVRYTLTFIADDVVVKQEELREGTEIVAPEAPAKEGFSFDGWTPSVPATMPAEDVTLTAVYSSLYATVTIGSAGMATYSDSRALDFTDVEGLKAYIASGFNPETCEQTLTRVRNVPAGEGLLLKGAKGTYQVPYKATSTFYVNLLKGVPEKTMVNPTDGSYTNFILANDATKGVGFYPLSKAGELGPNKAYLQLPTAALPAGARVIRLLFEDEETTGVGAALNDKCKMINDKAVFDLQGRHIAKPTRGLYIKAGKKVFVR